jgi:phosphoribosylamine--glycine ligase
LTILIIGSGGREHALAWRLAQSDPSHHLHAAPGNPGIADHAKLHPTTDYAQLARELNPDMVVVGPEFPLVQGLADTLRAARIPVVGPDARNARLEGSKEYAKQLMESLGIPTARFETASTPEEAASALRHFPLPVVLKTDGLAAGKGVIIAQTTAEALHAIQSLPYPLVIEEFLTGEELSFIALCDGHRAVPLEPSQDHKRAFDGDLGPNTGGMGAYSDSDLLTSGERTRILEQIVNPILHRTRFTGFLYAGLMLTAEGPKVLEFNVRMGDPETQPLMMRLDCDWAEALLASATGNLRDEHLRWSPDPATCVVLASKGYPGTYQTGHPITGIEHGPGTHTFHAGTALAPHGLVTAGGRVLGVTARGGNLQASIAKAYEAAAKISFEGMHYRKDIGARGRKRYNEEKPGT